MGKIITLQHAEVLCKQLKSEGKTIVLVGGCFDIFHYGHFSFLKKTASLADVLIIALENDQRVRQLKGEGRPITNQVNRAEILASFPFVDYVLLLPNLSEFKSYSSLVQQLKADIIAATEGDPQLENKRRQAEMVGGKVVVIPYIKTLSTSKLIVKLLHC